MNDPVASAVIFIPGNEVHYTKRYLHQRPLSTQQIAENFGVCMEGVGTPQSPSKVFTDADAFKQIRYDYFRDESVRDLFCTPGCYYARVEVYDVSTSVTVSKIFFTGRRDFVITIRVESIPANAAVA